MKRLTFILFLALLTSPCEGKDYPYRWVQVLKPLSKDSDVEDIKSIVKTASEHGLNGMALGGRLGLLETQPPDYFRRLEMVKQICKEHNVEIIPMIFSVGRGTSVILRDLNLATGTLVKDTLFVVENRKAHLVPDHPVTIRNGGFEEYDWNRFKGYKYHDKPGEVSFMDKKVFKSGKASIRFENFGREKHRLARVMQEVKVRPHRCYRLSCWVKTERLEPGTSLSMLALSPDGRQLAIWNLGVPSTNDWQKFFMGFNSLNYDTVKVYVSASGEKSGKFWVDDFAIEEVGLLNVLRRPGAPVTVRDEKTGLVYEEGKDFATIKAAKLNFKFDHNPNPIEILPLSRIREGQRLRVSYYHGMALKKGRSIQIAICMSEPKVYEIWRKQAKLIHKYLAPNKYLLPMDEIRAGGSCAACKKRKMTMAEMLGDCITKQVQIIREVNPNAEIVIWSDMLDPNHNAHDNYYLVDGDLADSWKYVPKDLLIGCWHYKNRNESLKFFSSRGFKTLAAAYYDSDTLETSRDWLEALDHTPKACGIIYMTWKNKYELLAPFGDLVTGVKNRKQDR